jgi:arylsulfatase A-like enzyme
LIDVCGERFGTIVAVPPSKRKSEEPIRRDGLWIDVRPLVSILLLTAASCRTPPPIEEPAYSCDGCNVVLISMDTIRADHVGAYGYRKCPTTPQIDALAKRGVLFENAISQSSWTRPAHLSIFTGLYPSEHGVAALRDRRRLHEWIPTLASELSQVGYKTGAFTGGVNISAIFGFDNGFDVYRTNGKYFLDNLEDTKYWLEKNARERFFLFFHGYDPHTPYLTDPTARRVIRSGAFAAGTANARNASNHSWPNTTVRSAVATATSENGSTISTVSA